VSDRLHVATNKGLFTLNRGSGGWKVDQVDFLGEPISVVYSDAAADRAWCAMALGHFGVKLRRSKDGGASWAEIEAPAYPPKPEGLEEVDGWGRPLEWRVDRIWSLAGGGPAQPDVLWAGTAPGGLFRSDNAGDTWEFNRTLWDDPGRKKWSGGGADLPMIHSICVKPQDPNHVTIGVSCGGVWVTPDGGKSWKVKAKGMWAAYMPPEKAGDPLVQDPHCVVQCADRPEVLYAQHHNGIFRSTNGAEQWEEIREAGPSTFGFTVAVHPHDPNTAWFVPAVKDERRVPVNGELVVTRTRDGGKTFDVLRNGLPEPPAYDLVYRHGMDVDETGDRVAFGSTTGGLWISEDQGDHWKTISVHLPPVNAVRFAR
jgi:hypothetical protein